MADSAALIVRINKANSWPVKSPRYSDIQTKFKVTEKSITSKHIIANITFFRQIKIPIEPSTNNNNEKNKKTIIKQKMKK